MPFFNDDTRKFTMNEAKRNTLKKASRVALATAAAGVFMTVSAHAGAGTMPAGENNAVHCTGINACKGQTECKTANNACKGHNSCKGQGWLTTSSEKECTDKG